MRFVQGNIYGLGRRQLSYMRLESLVDFVREMRGVTRVALDTAMTIGAWRTVRRVGARSAIGDTRDIRVLRSLAWAGFLSTGQIERLHFPSRRTTQRRLRALLDHGLVRACLQGTSLHLQNVYALTLKGAEHLAARGVVGVRPRRVVRLQKLEHALAVRDLFVAFSLSEPYAGIELEDFRFEDDLAKEPLFQSAGIIPDGLAVVRQGTQQYTIGCEIDLGTETGRMLKAKCALWAELLRSRAVGSLELLFVIAGPGRAKTIQALMTEAGGRCACILRSLVIAKPLEVVGGLFAPPIRAVRIGEPVIGEQHQLVMADPEGAFRICDPSKELVQFSKA